MGIGLSFQPFCRIYHIQHVGLLRGILRRYFFAGFICAAFLPESFGQSTETTTAPIGNNCGFSVEDVISRCKIREGRVQSGTYSANRVDEQLATSTLLRTSFPGRTPVRGDKTVQFAFKGQQYRIDIENKPGDEASLKETYAYNGHHTKSLNRSMKSGVIRDGDATRAKAENWFQIYNCPLGLSRNGMPWSSYLLRVKDRGVTITLECTISGNDTLLTAIIGKMGERRVTFDINKDMAVTHEVVWEGTPENVLQEMFASDIVPVGESFFPKAIRTINCGKREPDDSWGPILEEHWSFESVKINPTDLSDATFDFEFPSEASYHDRITSTTVDSSDGRLRSRGVEAIPRPKVASNRSRWDFMGIFHSKAAVVSIGILLFFSFGLLWKRR